MLLNHMAEHVFTGLVKALNHAWGFRVTRCVETWATPHLLSISWVSWLVKLVPQSLTIAFGTPTCVNNSTNASHTALAVNDFNMYTEGQRVQLSTTHKQYLWPCADGGSNGPIQSIFMTWNGTSARVIGVIGTRSVVTGRDLSWQLQHDCTWDNTDLRSPGQ